MPKYYCDYCDTYLTHDSPSVRKTHCNGRKHKENVRLYYQKWLEEQVQKLVDDTTAAFKAGKIQSNPFSSGTGSGTPGGAMIPPPASLAGANSASKTGGTTGGPAPTGAPPGAPVPGPAPGGPVPGPMPMMGPPGPGGPIPPMMAGMRPPHMGPMGPHMGPMGPMMGPMGMRPPMMAGPPKMGPPKK